MMRAVTLLAIPTLCLAAPALAAPARQAVVDRAPSYDTRWSDHSPLMVEYA